MRGIIQPECLFCKCSGPFTTSEHIIPASLGNDTEILEGLVCDICQNYLGREIEKLALDKTPFAFWRTYLGIKTSKGRLPSVDLTPYIKGRIPSFHPLTDEICISAFPDGTTSFDIEDPIKFHYILSGDKSSFRIVLSPWHLNIMGRFLGKIGLEFLAQFNHDLAFEAKFDELRTFVRYGSTKYLWPIFMGQLGKIDELKGPLIDRGEFFEQEIECYKYSFGISKDDEYIFAFSIGIDIFLICLSHRMPIDKFRNLIQGVILKCIHYPDGSW